MPWLKSVKEKNVAHNVDLDLQYGLDEQGLPSESQVITWVKSVVCERIKEPVALTIRLVDESEGAELNEAYRHKSGPTNVLSFPYDGEVELSPVLLGDIVICAPVVVKEAKEQNKSETSHWCHMVVHGVLHLLGYDHINDTDADEMEREEIAILMGLGFENPYENKVEA